MKRLVTPMRWELTLARWISQLRTLLGIPRATHQDLETGHYCVLNTAHIGATTAALLDLWSTTFAAEAPITAASTIYGWFVATRTINASRLEQVPADLLAVMNFGQARGFDYVLLDCDAATVAVLEIFSW